MTDLAPLVDAIGGLAPVIAAITALWIALKAQQTTQDTKVVAEATKAAIIATADGIFKIGERINGPLTELLEQTRKSARAEGVAAGEQAERDRQAVPPSVKP